LLAERGREPLLLGDERLGHLAHRGEGEAGEGGGREGQEDDREDHEDCVTHLFCSLLNVGIGNTKPEKIFKLSVSDYRNIQLTQASF